MTNKRIFKLIILLYAYDLDINNKNKHFLLALLYSRQAKGLKWQAKGIGDCCQ
jgi:hypothetical protein